jgi:hypothetical protein
VVADLRGIIVLGITVLGVTVGTELGTTFNRTGFEGRLSAVQTAACVLIYRRLAI